MPAKENGVQSSTISYSNVVIPDGITNNGLESSMIQSFKIIDLSVLDKKKFEDFYI